LIEPVPQGEHNRDLARRWFSADHIVPKLYGGSDDADNLRPSCRSCNSIKGTRTVEQFRWFLGMRARGAPNFTKEHIAWLEEQEVDLPIPFYIIFWGERDHG
jgi:hypothetical protein